MEPTRQTTTSIQIPRADTTTTGSGRLRSQGMQYTRLMPLGSGGMATVHLALAAGPGGFSRLVVVKAIREELLSLPEARAMFLEEARLCARLNHPNVVQVSEVVDSPSGVMIVMEYLDGRPLSAMLKLGDDFTLPMRLRVVCEILAGLHYVHELRDFEGEPLGLVHRDVSPHNVFATFDGRVKLLDFGIAKATVSSEHTKTGIVKGKLTYMPAEQLRGQTVDRRTDIYSVGCILWEAVTGYRLWQRRADKDIMQAVLRGDLPKLGAYVEVDPRLEAIVTRATALDPNARYATADDMRLAIEELLQENAPVSPRDIGELMSNAFAEANKRRHAEIAQLVAALPEGAGTEDIATVFQASVTTSQQAQTASHSGSRTWLWGASALSLTAAVLVVFFAWRGAPAAESTAAARPAASQAALSVSVVPSSAHVAIDDGAESVGSALTRAKVNTEHVVRVYLDGYSRAERRVTLTGDTSMTIELTPLPAASASAEASIPVETAEPSRTSAKTARTPRIKASGSNASLATPASANAASCSPPYYFVGGIKTFKPECI